MIITVLLSKQMAEVKWRQPASYFGRILSLACCSPPVCLYVIAAHTLPKRSGGERPSEKACTDKRQQARRNSLQHVCVCAMGWGQKTQRAACAPVSVCTHSSVTHGGGGGGGVESQCFLGSNMSTTESRTDAQPLAMQSPWPCPADKTTLEPTITAGWFPTACRQTRWILNSTLGLIVNDSKRLSIQPTTESI